ncbi:MAG TPA: ABC transporter permease [Bacteroidetes bacterium]|nr:ABC transporter permease [Bacteroidota bacterium]
MSGTVLAIAVTSIALSVMVMLVAVAIVTGFKKEITSKVVGFGAHIRIKHFDNNQSYEEIPVNIDQKFLAKLKSDTRISSVNAYATKAGIIRTSEDILGVAVKGVDSTFNSAFFDPNIIEGSFNLHILSGDYPAIISKSIADKMKLKLNDYFVVYFIDEPPRARKFKVNGIYSTGLEEFDNLYVFCPLTVIQKLNNWNVLQAGGFEVNLKNISDLESVNESIYKEAGFELNTQSIKTIYPEIFHWLELQDVNVIIILVLMILVAGINMVSTLLIILLDNTTTIGLLKAIGAGNSGIRKIFLMVSSGIVGIGLIAGNVAGLLLCWMQYRFHLVSLPQESYYVPYVPVNLSVTNILLINAGTLVVCILVMLIPSMIVSRISPVKALRYE